MNDETGLIEALRADPTDDACRHVYADWLEERGDPRADYLRGRRVRTLGRRIDREWREAVGKRFDVILLSFRIEYKIRTIASVRYQLGLGIKEAKDLVEAAPSIVLPSVLKEDAETLRDRLRAGYGAALFTDRPKRLAPPGCCRVTIRASDVIVESSNPLLRESIAAAAARFLSRPLTAEEMTRLEGIESFLTLQSMANRLTRALSAEIAMEALRGLVIE